MSAASHTSAGYPKVLLVFPTAVEVCRRMLRGILRYVRDAGPWELHIEESPTAKTLKALDARSFSGIIAYVDHAAALDLVLASRAPCVIVDPRKEYLLERKDLERFTRVSCDSGAIGRAAADYFLERHYKHFAFVGERNNIHWSCDRRDAFAGRVKQAGYGCHVYQPKHARQRPSPAKERSLLCDWLLSLPKPVALMAAFDVRGRQVIEACGRTGLVVPHEVSVLSVDNDEIYCGTTNPPMSSIQMREEEICYQAAALLQQRMLNRGCARPQALHYGVESILTRRSTEADQIEDPLLARAFHYIWQHLASPLRVADIASHLKSSPRLLELHARRFLGRTLQDEIQRAKMSRAHQLLLGSRLTVNEVAEACGFATTSHFIFCFRKHFRHTPTAVRKRAATGVFNQK